MKNIYVDTGDLSGKLLVRTIEKLEAAKKKIGYNYSADAYLEVTISMAKYNSPTGRQSLFNATLAETIGQLYGRIENVLGKLQEYRTILESAPDAIVDIDQRQKNEITNLWERTTYRVSSLFDDKERTGEDTSVVRLKYYAGPYEDIVNSYRWDQTTATKEEIEETVRLAMIAGLEKQNIIGELRRKLSELYRERELHKVELNNDFIIPNAQWLEIVPHKTNREGQRSPEAYREVLDDLDVEGRQRYTPGNDTWCNIYVWDATKAMGCEIPHYYDPNTGAALTREYCLKNPGSYWEMSAIRMTQWLERFGAANGWIECDAATAVEMANKGMPTVVAATTTGHVGMVVPQNAGDTGVMISQAGASNFNYGKQVNGFGRYPVKYFYHK